MNHPSNQQAVYGELIFKVCDSDLQLDCERTENVTRFLSLQITPFPPAYVLQQPQLRKRLSGSLPCDPPSGHREAEWCHGR